MLTETGIFESRVPTLVYLIESGQTDELKSTLARARDLVFEQGEEGLIRKLQLSRLPEQKIQEIVQQVFLDLRADCINEALK
ncbi:MAG TPA: hypothetical protein VFP23_01120 [Solirubrobacterales bacterium]|nr:hypothetical protein [Solirubrobacterales bacterium]